MHKEASHNEKKSKKKIVIIALFLLMSLIVLNLRATKVTLYSIIPFTDEGIPIPVVENGQEIQENNFKYSNSSGIIIATSPEVTCYWKPIELDDGWKECVSVFEVNDLRQKNQILNNPLVNVLFDNTEVKNVRVAYSDSYDVQTIQQRERSKEKEIVSNLQDSSQSSKEIVKTKIINEDKEVTVREFTDFEESHILVNTRRPFAIQVKYEAPKYASNRFNVTILDQTFNASIDPDQTQCGTLNTSGVYLLTQNVSSNQNCITLTANDIELNCQGRSITYGIDGDGGNGISFSGANNTIIKNCLVIDGMDDLQNAGYSVFVVSSYNTTFINNTIIKRGEGGYGIVFDTSQKNNIYNNTIINNGRNVNSIYIQSSSKDTKIEGNSINSTCIDIEEIYVDSASQNTTISNNTILKQGRGGTGITMDTAEGVTLIQNQVHVYAAETTGVFLSSISAALNKVENNIFDILSESSYGLYLSTSSGLQVANNSFLIQRNYSTALYVTLQSINNVLNNNTINATGFQIFGIYMDEDSTTNIIHNNTIFVQGNESTGIYVEDSGYEDIAFNMVWSNGSRAANIGLSNTPGSSIKYNKVIVDGAESNAIKVEDNSNQNIIENNTIHVKGRLSKGSVIDSSIENKILNSTIIVEGEQGKGMSFEGSSSLTVLDTFKLDLRGTQARGVSLLEGYHNFTARNGEIVKSQDMIDIGIESGVLGGIWNFSNVTLQNVSWQSSSNASLITYYFISMEVTFNGTILPGASVRTTNSTLANISVLTTNENGKVIFLLKGSEQRSSASVSTFSYTTYISGNGREVTKSYEPTSNKVFQIELLTSSSTSSGGGTRLGGGKRDNNSPVQETSKKKPVQQSPPDTLFDISLELPKKILKKTQTLIISIKLANLRKLITGEDSKKVNITLVYDITENATGQRVYHEEEIVPVETQNQFLKSIDITYLKEGLYTIVANLTYLGQKEPAIASETFQVDHNSRSVFIIRTIIVLIAVIVAITGGIFFSRRNTQSSVIDEGEIFQQDQQKDTDTSLQNQ